MSSAPSAPLKVAARPRFAAHPRVGPGAALARHGRSARALLGLAGCSCCGSLAFAAPPADVEDVELAGDDRQQPSLEIVIQAKDPDREDTHARTTLGPEALQRAAGEDLGETVSRIPGVTLGRGTADATKPIIRGQVERRLLVLHDGVRHESQKWGPEHATEIDPFSAGAISVIRGAAGARYGPDAIGGVILVAPPPMRTDPGVGGTFLSSFASNGQQGYGALRLDAAPAEVPGLSLRVEGNYARGASLSAPGYVLGNTGSERFNLGAAVQYRWGESRVRLAWRRYDLRAGVFYGVQHSTPDEFRDQLQRARPVTADLWSTTYAIDRPYQDVRHDVVSLRVDSPLGSFGTLETTYAFQINRREEFEQVRQASAAGAQYDFTLRTHSLDTVATHRAVAIGDGRLTGGIGAQGTFQENVYRGLPLIPNFRGFGGGAFAWERLGFERFDVEVGARFDHLSRTAFVKRLDYERHIRRDNLDPRQCEYDGELARCPSSYDTGSVSLGGLVRLVPERLDLKLDLSSANRFPNADELYMIGNAPTFPVHAMGTPDLGVETTWGASSTLGVRLPWLDAEVSGFASLIDQYIYFAPDLQRGGLSYEVNIRGTWPRYAFQPIDAVFTGLDGGARLGPSAPVGLDLQGALVRARSRATGEHLIGTPPDQARVALVGRPAPFWGTSDTEVAVAVDLVARQSRTELASDFAPPPDGYALLGLAIDTRVAVARTSLRLGVEARNLLNTSYREYTSLLRYYADQPGRDVRARLGFDF